jgi:hypothetical protein
MLELFSVDDHVIEPADVWSSRVPAKYDEAAPHVIAMGLNSVAGKPRETWGLEPARFSDMIPGSYDPKERSRDLLANGILASVNFPSLPGLGGRRFAQFSDKELADGNPPVMPLGNEDPWNGLLGAVGILVALLHRARSGKGRYLSTLS